MPSVSRTLLCTVPAALAIALMAAPVTPVVALASPLPMPLQADYAVRMAPTPHATHQRLGKTAHLKHNQSVHTNTTSGNVSDITHGKAHSGHSRQSFDGLLSQFSDQRDNAVSSSNNLQQLASQSSSDGDSLQFQQDAAAQFSALHGTMLLVQSLLGNLAADKGLANYDQTDSLETMIKDIVNANKDGLTAINVMVNNIPGLGPVLGPMVYDLKCLIDDILNALENITDGLINQLNLGPLFGGLANQANSLACGSQLKILGFCL